MSCVCVGDAPLYCPVLRMTMHPNSLVMCRNEEGSEDYERWREHRIRIAGERVTDPAPIPVSSCAGARQCTETGAGDALARIIDKMLFGLVKKCDLCRQRTKEMNERGLGWCGRNVETILDWLAESARKKRIPFVRSVVRVMVHRAIETAFAKTFDRVYVVNLDRRPDRMKEFERRVSEIPGGWPFAEIVRASGVDGKKCKHPSWWRAGGGAWGCYRSHVRLIEQCLNEGVGSVLLLEDDATFGPDFVERVREFVDEVPTDWGMMYLGGQHLHAKTHPPLRVNPRVYRPYNVNRTHAFALRGETMREVYRHLSETKDWRGNHHIDHHLGRIHQQRRLPIYCPSEWLVGQAEGVSNINGRKHEERFWPAANKIPVTSDQVVLVVGLHSSGSSCLAGVLNHLGVFMGSRFIRGPWSSGSFEAAGLVRVCEAAMPFPTTNIVMPGDKIRRKLLEWTRRNSAVAAKNKTVAGGKYPTLCAIAKYLDEAMGHNIRYVNASRPLEESVESLARRTKKPRQVVEDLQTFLWNEKNALLADKPHLDVEYERMVEDPRGVVDEIVAYLGISPTESQVAAAVSHVRKEERHVYA